MAASSKSSQMVNATTHLSGKAQSKQKTETGFVFLQFPPCVPWETVWRSTKKDGEVNPRFQKDHNITMTFKGKVMAAERQKDTSGSKGENRFHSTLYDRQDRRRRMGPGYPQEQRVKAEARTVGKVQDPRARSPGHLLGNWSGKTHWG